MGASAALNEGSSGRRSRMSPEVRNIIENNRSSCFQQVFAGLVEVLTVSPRRSDMSYITKGKLDGQSQIVVSLNRRHGRSRLSPEVQRIIAEHRSSCVQQVLSGLVEVLTVTPRRCGSVAEL